MFFPKVIAMDSSRSSPGFIVTNWRSSLILDGVVIWYDFPLSPANKTSKFTVGADMSTVIAFVDEFLVTDLTMEFDPTGKTLVAIMIDN